MKKVLFFLFAATFLVSCGDESHSDIIDGGNDFAETYPVVFNIPSFTAEKSPIQRNDELLPGHKRYVQYVVYNMKDTVAVNKIMDEKGDASITIEEELPAGSYRIAIVSGLSFLDAPDFKGYIASNYNTDYCEGNSRLGDYSNEKIYFECKDFTIVADKTNSIDIELLPMWSEFTVDIKDLATCKFPAKATGASLKMSPVNVGFNIKDKKGKLVTDEAGKPVTFSADYSLESIKEGALMSRSFSITPIDKSTLTLNFTSADETVTDLPSIKLYDKEWEAGFALKLNGTIGNLNESETGTFTYNKKPLVEKEIEF